jgi:NarL family two-component system response regulator LiaR
MLVDDHAVVREGLAAMIATEDGFELAASAGSIEEARAALRTDTPDLALLDLLLGDGDGLQLLRELRVHAPACTVLMLSSALDERQAQAALALGATGYLTKDMAGDDLVRAMKGALRGELQLSPKLNARRVRHGDPSASVQLSTRESDVLQLLAEGLANAEIAVRLGIGEATVKTHVGKLLAKLGVTDRTQAAIYAWRHGLVREQ